MKYRIIKLLPAVLTLLLLISAIQKGLGQLIPGQLAGSAMNSIQVSVPFLTIAPDGRSGGMGELGAASAPDINSQHWNAPS